MRKKVCHSHKRDTTKGKLAFDELCQKGYELDSGRGKKCYELGQREEGLIYRLRFNRIARVFPQRALDFEGVK